MILKMENVDGEDDKVKTILHEIQTNKGYYLKSDDKDDKDLAHTGPSKGCPSLGRASLTSLGRLDKHQKETFLLI